MLLEGRRLHTEGDGQAGEDGVDGVALVVGLDGHLALAVALVLVLALALAVALAFNRQPSEG